MQVRPEDINNLVKIGQDLVDVAGQAPDLKTKLKSRKFWVCIAGLVAGIVGMITCNQNTVALVSFAIVELGSILGYVIAEGYIDATRAKELLSVIGAIGSMVISNPASNSTFRETGDDANSPVEPEGNGSDEPTDDAPNEG